MKKQIFILVFVLFALGITTSYGQALAPRAITGLTSDALHPIAGQSYTYSITVPTPATGTKAYTWFVTQEPHFIAGGVLTPTRETAGTGPLVQSTGVGYNDETTGTNSLSIVWKNFTYDPTKPVFVVIQVKATDGCATKNMKAYKIAPVNAFTLDITNLDVDGTTPTSAGAITGTYGDSFSKCIHDIVDAAFDATGTDGVVYNYGKDYMFFEVVAANFNTSWKPTFKISGIDANETVTVEWAKEKAFTTVHPVTLTAGIWSSADVYTTAAAGGLVGSTGESIYVRITLDHTNKYQGLNPETVILAVDGTTSLDSATPVGDVAVADGKEDGYTNDIATQVLKPRPDIQAVAPALLPGK